MDSGLPRFPQDFTCPVVLGILSRDIDIFADGAITLYGRPFQGRLANRKRFRVEVLQPLIPKDKVWAVPGSLAATTGISM